MRTLRAGRPGLLARTDGSLGRQWVEARGLTVTELSRNAARQPGSHQGSLTRNPELGGADAKGVVVGVLGRDGRIIDLIGRGNAVFAAMTSGAIARIDLQTKQVDRWDSGAIGVDAARFARVGGWLYASGRGGVARFNEGAARWERILPSDNAAGPVVMTGRGPAVGIGRRLMLVETGEYLGSASSLVLLNEEERASLTPNAAGVFFRQTGTNATIGLMTDAFREVDVMRWTHSIDGIVQDLLVDRGVIWVITDQAVHALAAVNGRLDERSRIPLRGVDRILDLGGAPDGGKRVAFVGSIGRCVVDLERFEIHTTPDGADEHGAIDSPVLRAAFDGRVIRLETMRRVIDVDVRTGRARDSRRPALSVGREPAGPESAGARNGRRADARLRPSTGSDASVVGGRGFIGTDGVLRVERASTTGPRTTRVTGLRLGAAANVSAGANADEGLTLHTVVAIRGRLWIGHDDGVTEVEIAASGVRPIRTWRTDGAVQWIWPTADGMAMCVTRRGAAMILTSGQSSP